MIEEVLRGRRGSGVLLHPSSLPGGEIGSLGRHAAAFVDWLAGAGQSAWQILPLVPVGAGGSPYDGLSAFAGNPLLIDLELLTLEGLLTMDEVREHERGTTRVDYPAVLRSKGLLLERAHRALRDGHAASLERPFQVFRSRNAAWLDDYALFGALRTRSGGKSWTLWHPGARDRDPRFLAELREELAYEIEAQAFFQFLFERQWQALREHARRRGVLLVGDVPIFVAHDSADVWAHRELFELDEVGNPTVVAGVPPDYFSATGQRWGNPLYRWDVSSERGHSWWVERFRRTLQWVDVVRIDHFRGFQAYWEVPAEEETALNGVWRPGPGREFFDRLREDLGPLPVIAEDLGLITPEVDALRDALGFPGMRVLQFAFDGDPDNPHLPENHPENAVAYSGTHDNDTVVGWWESASESERERILPRLPVATTEIHWGLMELVAASDAKLVVFPAQDLLGLGSEAKMNMPGTTGDNWSWRLGEDDPGAEVQARLRALTARTDRLPRAEHADHNPNGRVSP